MQYTKLLVVHLIVHLIEHSIQYLMMHRVMHLVLLHVHTLMYILSCDASRDAPGVVLRAYSGVALDDKGDIALRVVVGILSGATFVDTDSGHEEAIKAKRR